MRESELVLQCKAAISRKYHDQVCHTRLAHGLPDHERLRLRTHHSNLTVSPHNPRCSDAISDDNSMRKSVQLFIIYSILRGQKSQTRAARRGIPNGLESILRASPTQPPPRRHATPPGRLLTATSESSTMPNPTKPL